MWRVAIPPNLRATEAAPVPPNRCRPFLLTDVPSPPEPTVLARDSTDLDVPRSRRARTPSVDIVSLVIEPYLPTPLLQRGEVTDATSARSTEGSGYTRVPAGPSPSDAIIAEAGDRDRPRDARPARHRLGRQRAAAAASTIDTAPLGPLAAFVTEQTSDLLVNGAAGLWVDDGHGPIRASGWALDEAAVRELAVRLIAIGGRHVDEAHPCVDVRIGAGMRVHVVLPPVSTSGTLLSVRIPRLSTSRLTDLRAAGMLTGDEAQRLASVVEARENLLITGAAGVGKTTLLAALLAEADGGERIVTVEDVAELRVDHPHVVGLEARQSNLEGAGGVGLDQLVREALRMRPDRLVVGECRGAELRELLTALNTGHDGGAGTLHANSIDDVPARLEALGALAGMTDVGVARQAVSAIGLVLHLERVGGVRRLARLGRFHLDAHARLAIGPA